MPIVVSSALLLAMMAERKSEVISAVRSADVTAFPLTSTLSPKLQVVVQHFQVRLPVRRHLDLDARIGLSLALCSCSASEAKYSSSSLFEVGRRREGIRIRESGIRIRGSAGAVPIFRKSYRFFGIRTSI